MRHWMGRVYVDAYEHEEPRLIHTTCGRDRTVLMGRGVGLLEAGTDLQESFNGHASGTAQVWRELGCGHTFLSREDYAALVFERGWTSEEIDTEERCPLCGVKQ